MPSPFQLFGKVLKKLVTGPWSYLRPYEFPVGWIEERNPTPVSCWVAPCSTQPTLWPKLLPGTSNRHSSKKFNTFILRLPT